MAHDDRLALRERADGRASYLAGHERHLTEELPCPEARDGDRFWADLDDDFAAIEDVELGRALPFPDDDLAGREEPHLRRGRERPMHLRRKDVEEVDATERSIAA